MKKKILILIIFSISITFGFTQPLIIEWQNCFGGRKTDIVYDITATDDGYLLAGSAILTGSGLNCT